MHSTYRVRAKANHHRHKQVFCLFNDRNLSRSEERAIIPTAQVQTLQKSLLIAWLERVRWLWT